MPELLDWFLKDPGPDGGSSINWERVIAVGLLMVVMGFAAQAISHASNALQPKQAIIQVAATPTPQIIVPTPAPTQPPAPPMQPDLSGAQVVIMNNGDGDVTYVNTGVDVQVCAFVRYCPPRSSP
ncbi:hypothetical protein HGA91_02565 [candidate division WWE3 bacterium]|nr:hypothetical protein [candidate division WWE3 bacterium]